MLGGLPWGLIEHRRRAFEDRVEFVRIDDTRLTQRLGLNTHQPRRDFVFHGENQVDVQVVPHNAQPQFLRYVPNKYA